MFELSKCLSIRKSKSSCSESTVSSVHLYFPNKQIRLCLRGYSYTVIDLKIIKIIFYTYLKYIIRQTLKLI